jgi:glycyl-tRNA synthetase alpha subunit
MIIDGEITENNIKDVLEHDYNFNTNDEVLQAKILNPKELGSKAFLFFSSKFDYREIINITPECFNIVNIAVSSYIADILQYIGRHIKELKHYISPNQFIRGYREYHEKLDPKNEKIQSLFHMTLKLMDIEQNKEIYQIIEYKIQSETQDTSKIGEEVYNDLKKEEEISKDTITMNLEIAQRSERND